ncbi:MAG: DUF4870 domain-containing protein [Bacteroidetes bacterium]|nr:DUF4870 domain-containing protein [Bacteroidota bacterium]
MEQTVKNIQDERMWGMFCHLSALAGYIIPLGSIIGPLVIWSIKKMEFPFVDDQGKEALNFQISMFIYMVISAILIIIVVGILLLIALGIFQLIMIIIASIRANNGETFRYPLTIRFIN